MVGYYLVLVCLLFYGAHLQRAGINESYMSISSTNVIKGFFIALIFMSHIQGYIRESGYEYNAFGDDIVISIIEMMGQLVVIMFLFYSGYGIMESYKTKGDDYISTMPKRRILTTLLNFDIAVLAFIVIDLLLGIPLGVKQILMSLIGRMSVGNSNWYIFVILLCYVITYFGLKYFHKTKIMLLGSILIPSILVYIFLYSKTPDEPWWYNTIFCFWAGFTYSVYKDIIEKVIKKNYTLAVSSTIFLLILISMFLNTNRGVKDNLFFMVFAFLIVLVTMKINFRSKPLHWMGKRLFPLYIYQRIPMIVLYEFDKGILVNIHPIIYIILCGSITFLFGYYYHLWQVKIA